MKFEQKALTDIKAVQTAYFECNSTSVKKSFISKKTTDAMLKYYVKDYKNKCKQLIDDGHGEFLAKLAGEVIEQIKIYTRFNWPQTYDTAKAFVVNGDEIEYRLNQAHTCFGEQWLLVEHTQVAQDIGQMISQ